MEQATYPKEWQGLPPIPTQPYNPLGPEQQAEIEAVVESFPALLKLVRFTAWYDEFGPYQAMQNDWEQAVKRCCHLRSQVPGVGAGLKHFVHTVDDNGAQFPRRFFDFSGPKSYLWDLGVCNAWIHEGAMMHRNGSYMGGLYRFKWLVLLLVHFYSCGSKINAQLGPMYEGITPKWSRKDAALVQVMVGHVQQTLNESVLVLVLTKAKWSQEDSNMTNPKAGLLRWTDGDVTQVVLEPLEDKWTSRGYIVMSGLGGDQVGPKAAQRPAESKKQSRKHLWSDNDPEDDNSEAGSERKAKKKSKSNSSGADPEEHDGFTYNRRGL